MHDIASKLTASSLVVDEKNSSRHVAGLCI